MKMKFDVTNAKWDLSQNEKYAIKWLEGNGFHGKIDKQYISKTHLTITKNGVTDYIEIPTDPNINITVYMDCCKRNFELLCENRVLKEFLKRKGIL